MTIGLGLRSRARASVRRLVRAAGFQGEDGGLLIELAVTLPFLVALVTGATSFSLAFYEMQELGNAVSAAAQELGETAGTVADPCAQVVLQVNAALPNINTSLLTYSVTITNAAGTQTTYSGGAGLSCKAAGAQQPPAPSTQEAANEPQTVTVSYQYPWMPFFSYLQGWKTPSSQLTVTQTTMGQ